MTHMNIPVAKASSHGYYAPMLEVIKALMSTTLKDNTALQFAVLKIRKNAVWSGKNRHNIHRFAFFPRVC